MGTRLTPRLFLIGFAILLAIYFLYPTAQLQFMTPEEKERLNRLDLLQPLQERALNLGLDLQGGMHVVMEVDVAKLVENLAENLSPELYDAMSRAREEAENLEVDFLQVFERLADESGIKLARHFLDRGIENSEVIRSLEQESDDAVNRALEVIRNRVDQFGVSEPTIQKQGRHRIIVQLAGVQDPGRARNLIQQTALLEFSMLREPEVVQSAISRIDRVLRSKKEGLSLDSLLAEPPQTTEDDTTSEPPPESEDISVSIEELFGGTEPRSMEETDTSSFIVDQQIFGERPFSALLRNVGGDIGIPLQNYNAVRRILEMPEVKEALPTDMRFVWSSEPRDFGGRGLPSERYHIFYAIDREPALTGGVITAASANIGGSGSSVSGQPLVFLNMNSQGAKVWSRLTGANIGKRVAIVLDNKVHSAPVIRSKIPTGNTQIEGMGTIERARDLAIILRAGALPAPMEIIEERTVGPSLGHDSIQMGTYATILGFSLVVVFMMVYYKFSGVIADLALLLNLTFVLAIMSALGATLTLPGIAGLILTIGISVDANVLIFERIREELRKGKTVRSAIDSGYSRAMTTIIDANVTTVIAALVLFQFGTGPIKGFAVTLFWGIMASMFTAVFITRTILVLVTDRTGVTRLSI